MKNLHLVFLLFLFLSSPAIAHERQSTDTLNIAISNDYHPFTFLNNEGEPAGMFVDIWRLWAKKTNRRITFIASSHPISLENLHNQIADIHSGLIHLGGEFGWLKSSQPLYEVDFHFFFPVHQAPIATILELAGQTVAVQRGGHTERFLKNTYPDIRLLPCETREELVEATRRGDARGFLAISHVGASVIDRLGVSGEFESFELSSPKEKLHAVVANNNGELVTQIDTGLAAISTLELSEIEARWIKNPLERYYTAPASGLRLSDAEKIWLRNHKTVRVGMSPVAPPLKFSENGVVKGIEPDYLDLLSKYTGIQFEFVLSEFSSMDAKAQSGELDMFLSFQIPERQAYMMFTDPFMDFKQVIVTRMDEPFISGLGALKGKRVAVIKGVLLTAPMEPFDDRHNGATS